MPLSPTRLFVCTACGATLPVSDRHVGKKCRCGGCGQINLITDDATKKKQKSAEQIAAENKQIHFHCRVCDTHLAALIKHVGRKAKCPDCGALTAVPKPPESRPKQKPKAMHGQQYGVWGVDEAPDPKELKAKQPKQFPVYCRVCDTLMYAQHKQIGKKLQCPDCGAKTEIKEPPKPKPKKSVLVPDGQEYQLDVTHAPPVRPAPQFVPPEPKREIAEKDQLVRKELVEHPKLPNMPTLQGLFSMLLKNPVPAWWFGISLALALNLGLLTFALATHSLVLVVSTPILMAVAAVITSGTSAVFLSVLTESSEGNDRIYNPPGVIFLDWIGNMFYLINSGLVAFAPWWLISFLLKEELTLAQQGVIQACGWLFTFPLLLLSSLENGSPLEIYSVKIFDSLAKRPGHWLLLLVQSVALAGACLLAVAGLLTVDLRLGFLAAPLLVAAGFLYFRILGRFAWWLAESLAIEVDTESD